MTTGKVSSAFRQAIGRAPGIEEAKAAESSLSSIPFPDGWEGEVVVVDMIMDTSQGKGNAYCNMVVTAVNDPEFEGKKATKNWTFNETTNSTTNKTTTIAQRFEWFLNDLEYMGLPREIRTSFEDEGEIVAYFLKPDEPTYLQAKVTENSFGKQLRLRKTAESVDNTTSMTSSVEPSASTTAKPKEGVVIYMEAEYTVVTPTDDKGMVKIKSVKSQRERTVPAADVKGL